MPSVGVRGDAERCRNLGVDGYLTKPVIYSELHDLLCLFTGGAQDSPRVPEAVPVTRYTVLEQRDRLSILVAEDVEVNQMLIQTILARQGHATTLANNGAEAVETWRLGGGGFDLILMDVQMPVLDGLQATAQIRALEKESGGHIPIAAMTAYAMSEDRAMCRAAGMDDYVSKPFKVSDVVELLARLVPGAGVPRPAQEPPPGGEGNGLVQGGKVGGEGKRDQAPEDRGAIFDKAAFVARLGGQESQAEPFLALFRKTVAGNLPALREAACAGDADQVRKGAHLIKGISANVGAIRMQQVSDRLEQSARQGELSGLGAGVDELLREYESFKEVAGSG